ncbi:AaceriACL081Cp [[Ashbya] aceris (nom. inval.)]|nr:AaceriACL081Cp [[Ashbya] aceris (nom. inval.)]
MWASGDAAGGRRQRLMNMVRVTKDTYLPAMQNSLTQARSSLRSYYYSQEEGEGGERAPPSAEERELQLICYPTYTRVSSDRQYVTQVRGMVYVQGQMTRRNRLILSICKQLARPTATAETERELESVLNDDAAGSRGTVRSASTANSNASTSSASTVLSVATAGSQTSQDEVLRDRLAGFLNKAVPSVSVIVDLLDAAGHQETLFTMTDNYGQFRVHTTTGFQPTVIRATIDTATPVSTMYDTNLVEDAGIGLISDIDDTIKHTGVVGDKRSIFCNVFVSSFNTWLIPGMSLWYNTLKDSRGVDFFYVSNSPFQIYPTLRQYISNEYPIGPMFLKQYSGNLLSSLMSSTAAIKLPSITQICADFPKKKFILVGDSGEEDLEAYIATARNFPNQIIGIYIRCCKSSMSDDPARDWDVMDDLNSLIATKYFARLQQKSAEQKQKRPAPPVPAKRVQLSEELEEDILRSKQIDSMTDSDTYNSTSRQSTAGDTDPYRSHHAVSPNSEPPPLPPRTPAYPARTSVSDDAFFTMPSTQNDYGIYSAFFDRKADEWKERVTRAINILLENGVEARFMFFRDPEVCIEDSMTKINFTAKRKSA